MSSKAHGSKTSDPATDRNVLLITADEWRGDSLGCLGHPCLKTPHLDRLASEGVLFRRHFTQASPCGPARASLYTGLYMCNHRAVNNGTPLDARFTNVALEARRAGYDPTLFGYTSTSVDPRTVAAGDPRLNDYEGILPGMSAGAAGKWQPWFEWLRARGFTGPLSEEISSAPLDLSVTSHDPARFSTPAVYSAEASETAFMCDAFKRWVGVREGGPWFAHISIKKPHPPWIAPEPYNRMYSPAAVPPPRRAASVAEEERQHPLLKFLIDQQRRSHYTLSAGRREAELDLGEIAAARAVYYGLMSEVDHHIGGIAEFLRGTGDYDRTLIIFTSDHGEHLGDHYLCGKNGYFDAGFHIPLIIRDPRANGGAKKIVDSFTEAVDVMPTILDWLDLSVPDQCDGESLKPFLHGSSPADWRSEVHWEFDFREIRGQRAGKALGLSPDQCSLAVIRNERCKYVHFPALPPLLFDYESDPNELRNRAGEPGYQAMEHGMLSRMLSWRMTHADRVLANMHVGPGGLFHWRGRRYGDRRAAGR